MLDLTLMLRSSEPFFIYFMNNVFKIIFSATVYLLRSVFYRQNTKILYNPYSENPSLVALLSPSLGTSHSCRAALKISPSISVNHKCQFTYVHIPAVHPLVAELALDWFQVQASMVAVIL